MTLVLSDAHRRILDAQGHALVTGGPGSGKTTIALAKAQVRIEGGLSPGQAVLFLSFSRAAVARIITASKSQIPKSRRTELDVQTFHGFFWEIVRAYGYLLGAPKRLRLLLPPDEAALRSGRPDADPAWQVERERLFREEGLVVFDLFASKAHDLLARSQRLRDITADRYPLIIVDEAQDTADDQWACVKTLSDKSQLICLADLEQQIYDFRPGVSAQRVSQIMHSLNPLRVDLEAQNHRNPSTEILKFGNDILLNTPRGAPYSGVSRMGFRARANHRDAAIRSSVGILRKKLAQSIRDQTYRVALLATWGRGIAIISRALNGDGSNKAITHEVVIDEAGVVLSSRVVAFLLEPKLREREIFDVGEALDLAAAFYRAKGGRTHLAQARRFAAQASEAREGSLPSRSKAADEVLSIVRGLQRHSFVGDPKTDWLHVREILKVAKTQSLVAIAVESEQLAAFHRGHRIRVGLVEIWQRQGSYAGARSVLQAAVAEDQLLSGVSDSQGISVMTIHKSKGKEFDGVIIIDEANNCPFVFCKETSPHSRSRRLLRVGITRARHHVLLLTDLYNPSALLKGHRL